MVSRCLRPSFLLLLGLLLTGPLGAARGQVLDDVIRYSERLPAAGNPSAGMSGAGLFAGMEEPTALFGNPAGLGWLQTSALGGDFAVQRARSNAELTTPDALGTAERAVSDYRLGTLAGAYSVPTKQGSLVFGVSVHQTNTYGRGFDVSGSNRTNSITGTFLPSSFEVDGGDLIFDDARSRVAYDAGAIDFSRSDYENDNYPFFPAASPRSGAVDGQMTLDQREDILESGGMNELSLGSAVAVAPGVMLGGGVNIAFGSYTFERFYRETDASDLLPPDDPANPQTPYDPYFLAGTDLEGFNALRLEERIDTDIDGVNFRLGLSSQVFSDLRGGLVIETPTWYNLTEVFGTSIATDFDCDFSRSGQPCPEGGVAGFESGSLTANEFEYRMRTPWRIGTGLQYTLAGLTVAGDLEFVDWTQANVSADDASFTALNRKVQALGETINTRVGAEYSFDVASVRVGVAHKPEPKSSLSSFKETDVNLTGEGRLFLSAGASYTPSANITFHVSWLQERSDDSFRSYAEGPLVRESLLRNRFRLGLTYRP